MAACLTKEDLLAIREFVNEQNEKAAQVVAFREVALDRLEPLNFAYIRGEQECAFEHSELLDDALGNGLGKEACWNRKTNPAAQTVAGKLKRKEQNNEKERTGNS